LAFRRQEEAIKKEAGEFANTLLEARAKRVGSEDAFAQLKQLKASSRENNTVDQLAARLYFTENPLPGEQANQITRIPVQNRFSAKQTNTVAGQIVSDSDYSAFRSAKARRTAKPRWH
jgi:hypothetical protein